MEFTLWRREFLDLHGRKEWLLVFGRRKTGKTFLLKLTIPWKIYATVTRDLTIIIESRDGAMRMMGPDEGLSLLLRALRNGDTVVIDEFQRLPDKYWSFLATIHPKGRLVLAGSSLGIVERVFDRRSPLLGLVTPIRVDPLALDEVIVSLAPRLAPVRVVLWSVLLREPWLTPLVDLKAHPIDYLTGNIVALSYTVRGLIGEVFMEEERELTRLYESVLRLLGAGVWSSRELANILYSRGLLRTPGPGTVTGILDRLARMGLVAKTRLWRSRGGRFYYRHLSPLLGIVYGVVERHAPDEIRVEPESMRGTLEMLLAREVAFSIGELLASYHDGVQAYTFLGDGGDVDVVVLDKRGRSLVAAYEVKLGSCSRKDRKSLEKRAGKIGAGRALLLCLGGGGDLSASDVIRLSRDLVRKWARERRLQV